MTNTIFQILSVKDDAREYQLFQIAPNDLFGLEKLWSMQLCQIHISAVVQMQILLCFVVFEITSNISDAKFPYPKWTNQSN